MDIFSDQSHIHRHRVGGGFFQSTKMLPNFKYQINYKFKIQNSPGSARVCAGFPPNDGETNIFLSVKRGGVLNKHTLK